MPLPIAYQTVVDAKHVLNNVSFNLNLARTLARLKAIYFVVASTTNLNQ